MTVDGLRSACEQLFECYCENRDDIDWVYKNGDTGQQYLSIVCRNNISFKEYAVRYNVNWGFVRDRNNRLYINNTEYTEDMSTVH